VTRLLGPCLFCGLPAEELHHWTASLTPDGPYLDPAATVPLCIRCHHAEHGAWRELGMERFADPLEARQVRLSWLWQRLSDIAEHTGQRTLDTRSQRGMQIVIQANTEELARRLGWGRVV